MSKVLLQVVVRVSDFSFFSFSVKKKQVEHDPFRLRNRDYVVNWDSGNWN